MTGDSVGSLRRSMLSRFPPVDPIFRGGRRTTSIAAQKLALPFSPVDPLSFLTGTTTEFAYAYSVFFPVNPIFREGRGTTAIAAQKLALPFSPVSPLSNAAFAALKVSLWRRMSAVATGFLILTKRQHPHFAWLVRMFSPRAPLSFSRCVFAWRKRISYKIISGVKTD